MSREDRFDVVIPASLEKSEDGRWKVRGLASTEDFDLQGEKVLQSGMDLSRIAAKKGVINYDHLPGPENVIGVLDGYAKTDKGLFIEGRLFKKHTKAKAVREIMESLEEDDHGRVGISLEGAILKRNAQNPNIIEKVRVDAVALTMKPVNTKTYADLCKSLNAGDSDIEFDTEETIQDTFSATQVASLLKALGAGSGGADAPDTRSGGDALAVSNMSDDEDKKEEPIKTDDTPKGKKKLTKSLYKSCMVEIVNKLRELDPTLSENQAWGLLMERMYLRHTDILRAVATLDE